MLRSLLPAACLTAALTAANPGTAPADHFASTFRELAPGVWAVVRDDEPLIPVLGNTTFVISDSGVIVFDGGGLPIMSERVIEKIRSLTTAPVTHVAISHWHGDHHMGVFRFAEEYPNVQFIAQAFTHAAMKGSPMDYVKRFPTRIPEVVEMLGKQIRDGNDGEPIPQVRSAWFQRFIDNADAIDLEYRRARLTLPTLTFEDRLLLHSGSRTVELRYLGDGNTAGDIVMWLPDEKIVASGDLVVFPTPYGFNVPPRTWAETLRNLQALEYEILVPGHGEIQQTHTYVDLLIETAESIANQRDALLSQGMDDEAVMKALDYSAVEQRFTAGDAFLKDRFDAWFAEPFRRAAIKALKGEPMVSVEPTQEEEGE